MAEEWKRLFAGKPINKILTIEASRASASPAVVARHFGVPGGVREEDPDHQPGRRRCIHDAHPVLHPRPRLRRHRVDAVSSGADDHVLHHRRLPRQRLRPDAACIELCRRVPGATVEGIGIAIEKGFQPGGDDLRERRLPTCSRSPSSSAMDPADGRHRVPLMSRKRNVDSEGGVVFIDPKTKALIVP